jgi:hypothetical protein
MRPSIAFLAMLDTGLPDLFPTPPPLVTGASSTDPLLIPNPSSAAPVGTPGVNPPAGGTTPCNGSRSHGPSANAYGQVFYGAGNGGFSYCPTCTKCAGNNGQLVENFTDFGEAVLRTDMTQLWGTQTTSTVQGQFWPVDYFVPYTIPSGVTSNLCGPNLNTACPSYLQVMNRNDWDMGVSGTLLFDDDYYNNTGMNLSATCQAEHVCQDVSMLLSANKRGDAYVLRQYDLGQYTMGDDMDAYKGVVSEFQINSPASPNSTDEPRMPAYWNPNAPNTGDGFLVIWPWNETLTSFQWEPQSAPPPEFTSQYDFTAPPGDPNGGKTNNPFAGITFGQPPIPATTGYAGGALMLTVNPQEPSPAAIVWAVAEPSPNLFPTDPPGPCIQSDGIYCLGYLFAYELDGTTGALTQIWPKNLPTNTTIPDFASTPFASPTAAHGHVYVPAFGLCTNIVNGNCQPGNLYTNAGVQVYGF